MAEKEQINTIVITGVFEHKVMNEDTGKSQNVLRVQFSVGEHGPYFLDFPKDSIDNMAIIKEVEDRGHAIRKILSIT